MKRNAITMQAISKPEKVRYLHLYYDLSEDVRADMFARVSWDEMEGERLWHMENTWEELAGAAQWFNDRTGYSVRLETVHGPGTERYFPVRVDYSDYYANGPEELAPIPENAWGMCYEYDVLIAWNKHVTTINQAARVAQAWEDADDDTREKHWYELQDAQQTYIDAINDGIQEVCDTLNADEDAENDYTFTREFWEERTIDCADYEMWFTSDGKHAYMRDSDTLTNVDTCEDVDIIFENNKPHVIVARESC